MGKDFPGPVRSGRSVPAATALVGCSGLRWPDLLQKQAPLQPRQVPRGEVFRPHRRHLEHLEPVDFLGKAKVVSPAIPDDQHEGTQPQQPQVQGADGEVRPGAAPRAGDTVSHRTATSCGPRMPSEAETEVGSGQVAQVICDEQSSFQTPLEVRISGWSGPRGPFARGPVWSKLANRSLQGVAMVGPASLVTVMVQCAFTLALKVPRGADLSTLRTLLSQALPHQAQHGQLSYRDPSNKGRWVPLPREETLQRAWRDAAAGPGALQLQCRGAGGRPALYQVVAQHNYSARGPEDLALQRGDVVDVLCEVDQAWLEGHCDGHIGIFPKCFVVPTGQYV
uniref:NADPH oxidase activator 1 n=1 Tax=Ursus maritimus TaxID=29073 RepID=A0A452VFB4_URSMA